MSCRFWTLAWWAIVAGCGLAGSSAISAERRGPPTFLARYVPADARVFLEINDTRFMSSTPAGSAISEIAAWLMQQVKDPGDSIADGSTGLPAMFSQAIGLKDNRVADLILTGRLAIAADSGSELSSAVLLALPNDVSALEAHLRMEQKVAETLPALRQYQLGPHHALATDGRLVIVGRKGGEGAKAADLYNRTLELVQSDRGICMFDLAEFQERMAEVPANSSITFYHNSNRRRPRQVAVAGPWPFMSSSLRSVAVGGIIREQDVIIETSGRLESPASVLSAQEPPVDALLFLPSSTLVAWTCPIRYSAEYRQLKAAYSRDLARFYIELIEWGMAGGRLERDLLNHLVGDSVLIVGQTTVSPKGRTAAEQCVQIPTFALAIETDNPASVDGVMLQIASNLLRVVNLQLPSGAQAKIEEDSLNGSEPTSTVAGNGDDLQTILPVVSSVSVRSVPLATLLPAGAVRELLGSLELSWTVADGWLIVATHRNTVRQIMEARRGHSSLMPADPLQQAVGRIQPPRRFPDTVLVAQPGAVAGVIDSWLNYLGNHHPEMLQAQWWNRLRSQYVSSRIQLGVVPGKVTNGEVEVARTYPDWPAHGQLLVGDHIIAVDGQLLDPQKALQSLRDQLAKRSHEDRVTVTVLRAGQKVDVPISMLSSSSPAANVHPLSLLKQIARLSRIFIFASYTTWQPSRDMIQTRLELRIAPVTTRSAGKKSTTRPESLQ